MRELPRQMLASYPVKGDHTVEAARFSPEQHAIWINKTHLFKPAPQAVWDFRIGGYQVLDKYLKSRKGRELSLDEIYHVSSIAGSPRIHDRPVGENRRRLPGRFSRPG